MPTRIEVVPPLVLLEARGALGAPDAEALTRAIDARIDAGQHFLVVGDLLHAGAVDAAARRHLGEHRRRTFDRAAPYDLGLVLALRSPVVRGALTAISWISGAFGELTVVDDRARASEAARRVLAARGQHVPVGALDAFTRRGLGAS